jgi:hypothetical protein
MTEDEQFDARQNQADTPAFDPSTPLAPRWRRLLAHSIDLTIVLVVLALFLTPIIALYGRGGSSSAALTASAWVYVAVFVGLGASLTRGRNRQRTYVTVGMNIMNIRPVRMNKAIRFVSRESVPDAGYEAERHGLAMAGIAAPMLLLGIAFVIFELFAYL